MRSNCPPHPSRLDVVGPFLFFPFLGGQFRQGTVCASDGSHINVETKSPQLPYFAENKGVVDCRILAYEISDFHCGDSKAAPLTPPASCFLGCPYVTACPPSRLMPGS